MNLLPSLQACRLPYEMKSALQRPLMVIREIKRHLKNDRFIFIFVLLLSPLPKPLPSFRGSIPSGATERPKSQVDLGHSLFYVLMWGRRKEYPPGGHTSLRSTPDPPYKKKEGNSDTATVFLHANCEEALKAAKRGARGNSGRWFGRESESGCFCVYEGGKVVERHITKKGAETG